MTRYTAQTISGWSLERSSPQELAVAVEHSPHADVTTYAVEDDGTERELTEEEEEQFDMGQFPDQAA